MNIVVTEADAVVGDGVTFDALRALGDVHLYGRTSPEELPARIAEADIVLCNKVRMTAEVMAAAPRLRYIGLCATGYNNVDTAYAREHGITVCNVPSYSTDAVAQHTFAFILAHYNRIAEYHATVEVGDWIRSPIFSYFPLPIKELSGKAIGIVGYGAIGRRVADIAKAFGMTVLVHTRRPCGDATVEQVPLEELLARADIVTLHCPLNEQSAGMMNAAAFARMKEGALFINTARGPLVDEAALRAALDSGHLGGAGLDVLAEEPMAADCPLIGAPRCLMTPHVAWAGRETRERLVAQVADNVRAFLNGNPINVVL
jgi:glycerate dehydrogenase